MSEPYSHPGCAAGFRIFLTRQTLAVQAIHAAFTAYTVLQPENVPGLLRKTHAMAVPVNGMGIFVMVQYYLLVATHPDFKAQSRLWSARGVPFKALMHWMHTPCGLLAFVDLTIVKQRTMLLEQTPAFGTLMVYYFGFVLYYVTLIHVNHALTGQWPYGMLKKLGLDPLKWIKFTVTQFMALAVFASIALATVMNAPTVW